MLAIESVLDVVSDINLVNDLIGILLQRSSKDHNLIMKSHGLNELHAARSHQEEAIILVFNIVDQGLVQIEHKSVSASLRRLKGIQEGWEHLGQVGEVIREDS